MPLPKLAVPTFATTLPSDGTKVTYRPFVGSEEKALLIATEAGDVDSFVRAAVDVIDACITETSRPLSVRDLPFFDVEHMLLKIRAKSVGEVQNLTYRHAQGMNRAGVACDGLAEVAVDLENVDVVRNPLHERVFPIAGPIGVRMRYPTLKDIEGAPAEKMADRAIELVGRCVESVYEGDSVSEPENEAEVVAWLSGMTKEQVAPIKLFFETMPRLQKVVKYECPKCGQEDEVTLTGLHSFF